MAFDVTLKAKSLANQISIKPNLIVEIEGVPLIFGIAPILEAARWDNDLNWDETGLRWDGLVEKKESRAYLSFKKSTKTLAQQVLIDKGGSSSISTLNVQIINKNTEVSQALSFDQIEEILGKKCNVYLNFAEGSHPEDSIPIFRGHIFDYGDDNTSLVLAVSHSENLKKQAFLTQYVSNLTDSLEYKELTVQDIFYEQRNKAKPQLSIEYVAGGSTTASISGLNITVTVTGSSNANDVIDKIRSNTEINALISAEITGIGTNIQVVQSLTPFTVSSTVKVESTADFIASGDALTSYIKIGDEIMEVVSVDSEFQFSVNRAQLGTFANTHDLDSDTESLYRLMGNPFDLALKIMLSEEGNAFYESSEIVEGFRYVNDSEELPNGIIFSSLDIQEATGLTAGDSVRIEDSDNNNGDYIIDSFTVLDDGRSAIIVEGPALTVETVSTPVFSFLSKYAVLPTGLGMQPNEVDVVGFELEYDLYFPNFVDYDFKIKEDIDSAKDFIDTQIFYPQGLYSIPRKARSSVKYTSPPLSIDDTPLLDVNNIVDLQNLMQKRSSHKFLYNNVVVKFNKDVIDDKYKSSIVVINEDSFNRIKLGNKPFKIEADGLVRNTATDLAITRMSNRISDRYKFAARYFDKVQVLYKTGYRLEIGDVVTFGGSNTKLINLQTGERNFPVALYEITNKSLSIETGKIILSLLETGFAITGRFGVFSPASTVGAGSTTTRINLEKLLDVGEIDFEGEKWAEWSNSKIVIRSEDYTYYEVVTLEQVAIDDFNAIDVSALPVAPQEGYFVELANYDDQLSGDTGDTIKIKYTFNMQNTTVTAQIDTFSFEADVTGLVVGQGIRVHSEDFTFDSDELTILDISGNIITVEEEISFAPDVGHIVDTLDLASDSGDGYRYL